MTSSPRNLDQFDLHPRVVVYAAAWNEERLLPYFLRHYAWAEKIVLYDNHSDDRTREIAATFPNTEVRPQETGGKFDELSLLHMKNHCWKELRGSGIHWAVVVDIDELIYAPALLSELARLRAEKITLVQLPGYNMVADSFPTTSGLIIEEVNRGVYAKDYSKCCVFQPDEITEINYLEGAHKCRPIGLLNRPVTTCLQLLHMRFLGLDYVIDRNARQHARRSANNIRRRWGAHLEASEGQLRQQIAELRATAIQVIPLSEKKQFLRGVDGIGAEAASKDA